MRNIASLLLGQCKLTACCCFKCHNARCALDVSHHSCRAGASTPRSDSIRSSLRRKSRAWLPRLGECNLQQSPASFVFVRTVPGYGFLDILSNQTIFHQAYPHTPARKCQLHYAHTSAVWTDQSHQWSLLRLCLNEMFAAATFYSKGALHFEMFIVAQLPRAGHSGLMSVRILASRVDHCLERTEKALWHCWASGGTKNSRQQIWYDNMFGRFSKVR